MTIVAKTEVVFVTYGRFDTIFILVMFGEMSAGSVNVCRGFVGLRKLANFESKK
jgi:hypothetical protein